MVKEKEKEVAGLVAGLTLEDATRCNEILGRLKVISNTKSDTALAIALGLKQSSVSTAKSRGMVPSSWIINAANLFNVSADWLISGDKAATFGLESTKGQTDKEICQIEIVDGELSAGGGRVAEDGEKAKEPRYMKMDMEDVQALGRPNNLRAMEVRGDSMEPFISDKEMVLFDVSKKTIRDGKIYAVKWDGHIYIKKLYTEPGKLILRSANPTHQDIEINRKDPSEADSVEILGQAVWWCHVESA